MADKDEPTILTCEDIDNFIKQYEEDIKKPTPMTYCPSCNEHLPDILTDYYTGQCQECFYAGKPWCESSPMSDAYFKVSDVQ